MKKVTKNIEEIQIRYDDGSGTTIYRHQLKEIQDVMDALSFMERAQNIYEHLKVVFGVKEKST